MFQMSSDECKAQRSVPAFQFHIVLDKLRSRDSAVGIATSYGLDDRGSEFESPWGQEFSLLYVVQTGCGVHPTSYPMDTGGRAAGA
jgi:hypothetical protein